MFFYTFPEWTRSCFGSARTQVDRFAAGCRCHTRICTVLGTGVGLISTDRGINIPKSYRQCQRNRPTAVIFAVTTRHWAATGCICSLLLWYNLVMVSNVCKISHENAKNVFHVRHEMLRVREIVLGLIRPGTNFSYRPTVAKNSSDQATSVLNHLRCEWTRGWQFGDFDHFVSIFWNLCGPW